MKTNRLRAKHSSFCTMSVSPTTISGAGEWQNDLHFYSFFVYPHSKSISQRQQIPWPTRGLTGLGSLRPVYNTDPHPAVNRSTITLYAERTCFSPPLITALDVAPICWPSQHTTHCSPILGDGPAHQLLASSLHAYKTHCSKCTRCKKGFPGHSRSQIPRKQAAGKQIPILLSAVSGAKARGDLTQVWMYKDGPLLCNPDAAQWASQSSAYGALGQHLL